VHVWFTSSAPLLPEDVADDVLPEDVADGDTNEFRSREQRYEHPKLG